MPAANNRQSERREALKSYGLFSMLVIISVYVLRGDAARDVCTLDDNVFFANIDQRATN
jgi:hypothetical protein